MGLLERRLDMSSYEDDTYDKTHYDTPEEVSAEVARNQISENSVLRTIGEATNPLADRAIEIAAGMPEADKTLFMRNVFQRLVLQTLRGVEVPVQKTNGHLQFEAGRLGSVVVADYGSGMHINDGSSLEQAVIDESIPKYEQLLLEIPQNA